MAPFDPSFVGASLRFKEAKPILFEKCCDFPIAPVVQSSCHALHTKCGCAAQLVGDGSLDFR